MIVTACLFAFGGGSVLTNRDGGKELWRGAQRESVPNLLKSKKTSKKPAARSRKAQVTCGSVRRNFGSPPAPRLLKRLVLTAAAQPLPPLPGSTPNDTPISALRVGDPDPITTLTGLCMNLGQFQADGLWMNRLYALDKGKKLGTFMSCIRCCYSHRTRRAVR
jgi:hypothetical protein